MNHLQEKSLFETGKGGKMERGDFSNFETVLVGVKGWDAESSASMSWVWLLSAADEIMSRFNHNKARNESPVKRS